MGKINQGILGGFSGRVGSVVGSSWKGITFMRARNTRYNNPRTTLQMQQRLKFGLAMSFLRPMTPVLRTGYRVLAQQQSGFNAAQSWVVKNAISGSYPDYKVDYGAVLISRGTLPGAEGVEMTLTAGKAVLRWHDNTLLADAGMDDGALVVVYNTTRGEAVYQTDESSRGDLEATLALPADWAGDKVVAYVGFASTTGRAVSDSVFVSQQTVPTV